MEKELLQNPEKYEAVVGEKLEMHFRITSLPLLSKVQQEIIKAKLSANPMYKITETRAEPGKFIVEIVIVKNPFPLVLAIGGVITACAGFFVWASLDKVYKIIETPAGKIASVGIIASVVIGLIIIIFIMRE